MSEFHLYAHDEGTVYPFLGGDTTGLADDSTQVAFGETHTVGVVTDLVLLGAMLVDELNKAVKDGLLARLRG